MRSAAFSPTMIVGALMLPPGMVGKTEASATRRAATPRTLSSASTTAISSVPMRQVEEGCCMVLAMRRAPIDVAGAADAFGGDREVCGLAEDVEPDARLVGGVGRAQGHAAAALRMDDANDAAEGVFLRR